VGCYGKNAVKFSGRWLLKRLRKTMLELGRFRLEVYIGLNFNIKASNFNMRTTSAQLKLSAKPPKGWDGLSCPAAFAAGRALLLLLLLLLLFFILFFY
jgi:hypothetical protein